MSDLRPLTPLMHDILRAVNELHEDGAREVTANRIARQIARWNPDVLAPVRRHGNGAVKGSWSGSMAACQRILSPLGGLHRRGLLYAYYPRKAGTRYQLSQAGRDLLSHPQLGGDQQ